MNLLDILNFSKKYLEEKNFKKARLESEKIIAYVLNLDRISLYANFDKNLKEEEKEKIKYFLKRMTSENKTFDELISTVEESPKNYKNDNLELLSKSIEYLKKYQVPDAKIDAEYIFSYVLNVNRLILTLNFAQKIEDQNIEKIKKLLILRGKYRKPLQYIIGEWEFYGYKFLLDERVLIPRADTEVLVEQCKHIILDMECPKVLDIGSGSGAIAIAIAKEIPTSLVIGVDISAGAIEVSKHNKNLNKVDNVEFLQSDLFSNVKDKKFNIIISNPPYISKDEYSKLMPEVQKYEPKIALTDDLEGLSFYEKISKEACEYLLDESYLAFEIGYNQGDAVKKIMEKNKFDIILIGKDYNGNDRVIIGKKQGEMNVD
ncbi:MAG: peptide chain release factor N(5)-glutamine methyltransferase [Fusobacteriaceae bacterium]|jgi:release factor glutamine methyltransferase|nr:peptide chain release factor N(5)-glutamine methyltransferase [Fusobacteriaceae bacterium]